MANTYSKIYIHLVLNIQGKEPLIPKPYKNSVEEIMTIVLTKGKHELLEINCMPDHTHILFILRPHIPLSQLVEELKKESKDFIQLQPWMRSAFDWLVGFGAFTCSPSRVEVIAKYIQNQEEHHQTKTFKEEYLELLKNHELKS